MTAPMTDGSGDAAASGGEDSGALGGLWEEDEILAIIAEVQARKSVDTLKLFGGGSAELGEGLSRRTPADVKALINRCKGSFDASVAPWVPKCGVAELLAVLASEAAFCRTQRMKRAAGLEMLASDKVERARLETARREGKREVADLAVSLKEEEGVRKVAEAEREAQSEAFVEAKKELEEERELGESALDALEAQKLKEHEARRKLDRARLRVAALRGELVSLTLREFVRPSLRELRWEKELTAAEAADAAAAPTPRDVGSGDGSDDVEMEGSVVEKGRGARGKDRQKAAEKKKGKKASGSAKDGAKNSKAAGNGAGVHGGEELDAADAAADEAVLGWEHAEGKAATELRLLRNRLAMHTTEAAEWRAAADAERVRARMFQLARSRLEREAPPPLPSHSPADAQAAARLPPKARSKRPAVAPPVVAPEKPGEQGGAAEGQPRKRRKSTPVRAFVL